MADPLLQHRFGDDASFALPGTVARPASPPPPERRVFGKLRRCETAEPVLINTDFRRAIGRNKRNTVLLILTLAAISSVLGYVLGWAVGIIGEIWRVPAQQVAQIGVGSRSRTASSACATWAAPPRRRGRAEAARALSETARRGGRV
jgi:hypothetical protein